MSPMAKLVIVGGAVVTICLDQYVDIRGDDSFNIVKYIAVALIFSGVYLVSESKSRKEDMTEKITK